MDKITNFREAIKIGLATVLAYYLAMSFGWMNPTWAAISVGFISLPTAGQSINKGLQRLIGTLIALVFGLFFLSIYPQSRWLFFLAITPWLAIVGYKVSGKKNQYGWFVIGFVTMMITTAGHQDAAYSFQFAMFRTLETMLGIIVWTLVSVFIWPRSNLTALKTVGQNLFRAHCETVQKIRTSLSSVHDTADTSIKSSLDAIIKNETQFQQTLSGAASESYDVAHKNAIWDKLQKASYFTYEVLDKITTTTKNLRKIDLTAFIMNLDPFMKSIEGRLKESSDLMGGSVTNSSNQEHPVVITVNQEKLKTLDYYQKIMVTSLIKELVQLNTCSISLRQYMYELKGFSTDSKITEEEIPAVVPALSNTILSFFTLDPDRVRGSIMVVISMWVGALIWIYVDPPGHVSWYQFLPNVCLVVAMSPQAKFNVIKPFGYAYVVGLLAYIFIMPQLTMFWQLGLVLMAFTFAAAYLFTNSIMRTALYLSMYNMLGIQNEQVFNVASQFNTVTFTLLSLSVVLALTYITGGPRPEKKLISMVKRFFKSCQYINNLTYNTHPKPTVIDKFRTAYYRQELNTLPNKMVSWAGQIDYTAFAPNKADTTQLVISDFKMIAYRIEDFYQQSQIKQYHEFKRPLTNDIVHWHVFIQNSFETWSLDPAKTIPVDKAKQQLIEFSNRMTKDADAVMDQAKREQINEQQKEYFYNLTTCFTNLSEATLSYVSASENMDWEMLKEEQFS